jgi:uncharacterized protein (DUF433 family)
MQHGPMSRIIFDPAQCGRRPCIRGIRIRVKDVLELLAAGIADAEILADYPYLEAKDIRACLAFAAAEVGHPVLTTAGP